MKQYKNVLYTLLLLMACNNKSDVKSEAFSYDIKLNNIAKSSKFNDVVKSYSYIQLQTDSNSIIGEIKKLLASEDRIIIQSDGVVSFDKQGKFVYNIRKKGRGPSEFIEVTDISINGNELYVYDNRQYKVMIFDVRTGQFLESFRLEHSVKNVQFVGNQLIMNRGGIPNTILKNDDQLMVTKRNDQQSIRSYMPVVTSKLAMDDQLISYNSASYWLDPLFNHVYKITDSIPEPYLSLDFGSRSISVQELKSNPDLSDLSANGKAFFLNTFLENAQNIFTKLQLGSQPLCIWIDKADRSYIAYEATQTKPYQITPSAQAVYRDQFFQIIPVLECNFMKYDIIDKKFDLSAADSDFKNFKVVKEFKEENNPILAIYNINIKQSVR